MVVLRSDCALNFGAVFILYASSDTKMNLVQPLSPLWQYDVSTPVSNNAKSTVGHTLASIALAAWLSIHS